MRLTITWKLGIGFGTVVLIIIINVLLTSVISHKNKVLNEEITNILVPSSSLLNELGNQVSNSKMLIKNWVYIDKIADTRDKLKLKELHEKDFPELDRKIKEKSKDWTDYLSPELVKKYDLISQAITDTIFAQHKQIMGQLSNLDNYNDLNIMSDITLLVDEQGTLLKQTDDIVQAIKSIETIFNDKANDLRQKMSDSFISFQTFTIIAGVIVILMTLLVSFWITRSITDPLRKGVNFAQTFENGDISADINIKQNDEFGDLASALRSMQARLVEIIGIFITSAENIGEASTQINDSSKQLSMNAALQAASTEEISSSIQEIASNIQQNTDNSVQTEKISLIAATEIKKVNQAAHNSASSMRKIAEKISVINDIAFQTNILALNAAVEAARAGENGKGFAVVASEVRKLAERSKLAAEEIDELSRTSLTDSEESTKQLETIVPEIERTAKLIKEITTANLEQNSSIEQINNSIQQLNSSTQQSASSADKMLQNSDDLARLAAELKQTAGYFKI